MYPLRGRQDEIGILSGAWDEVRAGAVRFVLVSGDPGSGKTRLVQELYCLMRSSLRQDGLQDGYWPELNDDGRSQVSLVPSMPARPGKHLTMGYLWWALVCRQGNEYRRESFQPFADGLEQLNAHLVPLLHGDSMRQAWKEVAHGLMQGALGGLPLIGSALRGVYGPLRDLSSRMRQSRRVGLAGEQHALAGLKDPDGLEEALIQLLAALNNPAEKELPQVPVCIVLDDAQWADPRSIAFLQRLLELAVERGWRLLVVATARTNELARQVVISEGRNALAATVGELVHGLVRRSGAGTVLRIELAAELGRNDMRLLLCDQLPNASGALLEELLDRVGGQPFFAVNYARLIEEEGWLSSDGNWSGSAAVLAGMPREVESIIDRRLELLEGERRRVLNWASVHGWRFVDSLIGRVAGETGMEPSLALLQLDDLQEQHRLVSLLPPPPHSERIYQFSHRLIHERVRHAFSSASQEYQLVRRCLGELLREHIDRERLAEWPVEERLEALRFLHGYAGEQISRPPESNGNSWQLIRLQASVLLLEMLHARGDNYGADPLAKESWRELQGILVDGKPEISPRLRQRALSAIVPVFKVRGHWNEWAACNELWLDGSRRMGDKQAELEALLNLAELAGSRGALDEALELYDVVIGTVRQQSDPELEADALAGKANILMYRADYAEAQQLFASARELHLLAGNELEALRDLEGKADSLRARMMSTEAREIYIRLLDEYRSRGDELSTAPLLLSLGVLELYNEETDAAEMLISQALELEQRYGREVKVNEALRIMALIKSRRGQFKLALKDIKQGLRVARRLGDRHAESRFLISIGTTYMRLGMNIEALPVFRESLAILEELGDLHSTSICRVNIGMIHSRKGEDALALESFQLAQEGFLEVGDLYHHGMAAAGSGWALLCLGRLSESLQASLYSHGHYPEDVCYFNASTAKWLLGHKDCIGHFLNGMERYGSKPEVQDLMQLVDRRLTTREAVLQLAEELGL